MPTSAAAPPAARRVRPPTFDSTGPVTAPVARADHALAEPIAAAVLGCPAVSRLSAGPFGTVGTYLPGRRVTGVQVFATEITVRVVAHPVPLRSLETQIRTAVSALAPGLPIHIGVDDLDLPLDLGNR